MEEGEFRGLTRGNFIRRYDSAEAFLVEMNTGGLVYATRSVLITNHHEWLVQDVGGDWHPMFASVMLALGARAKNVDTGNEYVVVLTGTYGALAIRAVTIYLSRQIDDWHVVRKMPADQKA